MQEKNLFANGKRTFAISSFEFQTLKESTSTGSVDGLRMKKCRPFGHCPIAVRSVRSALRCHAARLLSGLKRHTVSGDLASEWRTFRKSQRSSGLLGSCSVVASALFWFPGALCFATHTDPANGTRTAAVAERWQMAKANTHVSSAGRLLRCSKLSTMNNKISVGGEPSFLCVRCLPERPVRVAAKDDQKKRVLHVNVYSYIVPLPRVAVCVIIALFASLCGQLSW